MERRAISGMRRRIAEMIEVWLYFTLGIQGLSSPPVFPMNSTIEDTIFNAFYNVGLKVARDMPRNTSHADTYNAFGKSKGAMIDHFFVRRMKVKQFRTLDGDYGVPYISDHYPIEMVIRL